MKLRFNNGPNREKEREELPEEIKGAAIVRWLQVYGRALAIGGGVAENSSQHVGFGRKLMKRAEIIAKKIVNLHFNFQTCYKPLNLI